MSDLIDIEKSITRLKRQLSDKRNTLVTIAPEEKERIRQQIEDLHEEIQRFEQEKWEILAEQSESLDFPEPEAETAVVEIVEAVAQLETQPVAYPEEVMQILWEIRDKLNEPGPTAAGKLKGILSSFPPFVGITYEAELDTENFARQYFPTFTKLIKGAAKK
ncbi:hypothetical protein [Vacuolonema iberomarrocanum]|uniref:hypothetical protein n=1 Tax=Vacuolonema iberomarrocanum TaxID=3454632 RepID=UPI003F6E22E7